MAELDPTFPAAGARRFELRRMLASGGSGIRLVDLNGDTRVFTVSSGATFSVAPVVQNGGVDKEGDAEVYGGEHL